MVPGEYQVKEGFIEINADRETITLRVSNTGDRPIQVGSHYHFVEVNRQLAFDREKTIGFRLNIPAGTAVRFEPGEEKEVELVFIDGLKQVYGLNDLTAGSVERKKEIMARVIQKGFKGVEHSK